jgi:hypothetical protein
MTRRPLLSAHALGTLREVARGPVPRTPPGNRVVVADLLQRRLVEVVPARSPAPAAGGRAATACLRITRAGLRVLGGGPEAVPAG